MRIGVPTERTQGESRVALAPHAVYELTRAGHRVYVEKGAGEASSMADAQYADGSSMGRPSSTRTRRLWSRSTGPWRKSTNT
jgi:alanine dehydrogenase